MQIVQGIDALPRSEPLVCTLGIFDGLHRGHQLVLDRLTKAARRETALAVAVTFQPHPEAVLRGGPPPLVCDRAEREERIAVAGVSVLCVQRFDRAFADQSPEAFLSRVSGGRQLRAWVMSVESAFGRGRSGTVERINAIAAAHGFGVIQAPALQIAGERVSSTRIRHLIEVGQLAHAAALLGRRYAVVGTVVPGHRRGRGLGYPTANLSFAEPTALPSDGVYAVRVSWGGASVLAPAHERGGVASLGIRPTFGGGERLLEAHLFGFDGDLYGQRLRVEFVRRQRGEKHFPTVAALVSQMDRDAARARHILET